MIKCRFCDKTFNKLKKDGTPAKWQHLLKNHCMIKHKKEYAEFRRHMRETKHD
jgi:hypothetical protein